MLKLNCIKPATEADVRSGKAVFRVPESQSHVFDLGAALPLVLTLGQDLDLGAGQLLPAGTEIKIVQAELVDDKDVIVGFTYLHGGGVCTLQDLPDLKKRVRAQILDVKKFALRVLEDAKEDLVRDKYLLPRGIIVREDETLDSLLHFEGTEEKQRVYRELVKKAREHNALAIITVNDAYWGGDEDRDLEGYYPGKLAAKGSPECVLLTISGPTIESWSVRVPYKQLDGEISFGPAVESSGDQLNFLEGWACPGSKPS